MCGDLFVGNEVEFVRALLAQRNQSKERVSHFVKDLVEPNFVMFVCEFPCPLREPGLSLARAFHHDLLNLSIPYFPPDMHLLSPRRHFYHKASDSPTNERTRN